MTIQEACKILGVDEDEDNKTVKLKFRKLIARYHPDAVGSDAPEHLKKAQMLNEAYRILRKRAVINKKSTVKEKVWKAKVKESVFTERTVYMQGLSWEDHETMYYEVVKGKYEWDPDLEEFECLLKSLNRVAMELLGKTEYQNEIYNDYEYDIKEIRFRYQIQLFHLLAGQFIPSVSCLRKLANPEKTDEQGRKIYKFQAFLGAKGSGETFKAMERLKEGDLVYPASLKDNRIMVSNAAGTMLGHLSFADDPLYYVVIPILKNHLAQVKLVVRETEIKRKTRPYRIKVNIDLYLRMQSKTEEVDSSGQNKKIQALLKQYDYDLKRIRK